MKNNSYTRHLIECQCILPIYRNNTKKIYHKFPVFSEIDTDDKVKEKYVACNNCDIIHKVFDICKSEIMWGKEGYTSYVTTKEDIIFNLKALGRENIIQILETSKCDISTWEQSIYFIDNKINDVIILEKEELQDNIAYKYLYFSDDKIKIEKEIIQRYF